MKKRLKLGNCRHGLDVEFHRHTWGAIAGAAISVVGGAVNANQASKHGGAAAVPYQAVDPTQVQKNAIAGDISTFDDANTLATRAGTATANQAVNLRNITQPGYSALAAALSKQATDMAKDPYAVPQSVVDQMTQYAAENNISAGTGVASGFSGSNLLRSLGINALQYGQTNLSAATSALSVLSGSAPNVSPVSPLSFMLTPSQALSTTTNNNTEAQAVGQGKANADAAAAGAANANLWDSVTSGVGTAATAYLNRPQTPQTPPPTTQPVNASPYVMPPVTVTASPTGK